MTEQNKIRSHFEKYVVTYLFIALSVLFIVVSGLDMNYVASQLLLRLNRNAFIVLALIIPIIAGMGINFAITIGAMAAQIGLLLTISWGVTGVPGIMLAAAITRGRIVEWGFWQPARNITIVKTYTSLFIIFCNYFIYFIIRI